MIRTRKPRSRRTLVGLVHRRRPLPYATIGKPNFFDQRKGCVCLISLFITTQNGVKNHRIRKYPLAVPLWGCGRQVHIDPLVHKGVFAMLVLANKRDRQLEEGMSNKLVVACVHEVCSSIDNKGGFVVITSARTPFLHATLRLFKDPS